MLSHCSCKIFTTAILAYKQKEQQAQWNNDKHIASTGQILTIHRKSNYTLSIIFYKCY